LLSPDSSAHGSKPKICQSNDIDRFEQTRDPKQPFGDQAVPVEPRHLNGIVAGSLQSSRGHLRPNELEPHQTKAGTNVQLLFQIKLDLLESWQPLVSRRHSAEALRVAP